MGGDLWGKLGVVVNIHPRLEVPTSVLKLLVPGAPCPAHTANNSRLPGWRKIALAGPHLPQAQAWLLDERLIRLRIASSKRWNAF